MRKISIGAVLVAGALVLLAVPAHAQFGGGGLLPELPDPGSKPPPEAYCTQYAADAAQLAQQASSLKCGFPGAPQWSTSAASQKAFCSSTTLNNANAMQASQRSEVERCTACRAYAKAAVSAAVDNVRYECGFGGGRWGTDEGAHFGWCMGLSSTTPVNLGIASVPVPDTWQKAHEQATAEAGARAQAIAQCKATHTPRDCKSCHGGPSQVSTAPARVSPAVLRATPTRGVSSSGSDQVRRGGCGSAMDRLSGDCMVGGSASPGSRLPDTSRGPIRQGGTASGGSSGASTVRPSTPQGSSGVSMPVGGPGVSGTFGPGSGSGSGTIRMNRPSSADTFRQPPPPPPPSDSYRNRVN